MKYVKRWWEEHGQGKRLPYLIYRIPAFAYDLTQAGYSNTWLAIKTEPEIVEEFPTWQQAMDQVNRWIRKDRQPVARKPRQVSPELADRLTRHSGSPVDRQCPVCGDYVYDFVQQCNECGEVLPGLPEPEDR